MREKITSVKTRVKTHLSNHRAKYAFATGTAVGVVVTREVALLKKARDMKVVEDVTDLTEIATEV